MNITPELDGIDAAKRIVKERHRTRTQKLVRLYDEASHNNVRFTMAEQAKLLDLTDSESNLHEREVFG